MSTPVSNVYDALYDLCLAALNRTFDTQDPPQRIITIPVVKGRQGEASPSRTTYVAISDIGLQPYGTPDQTNATGSEDSLKFDYTAPVALWEVYGDGSKLAAVLQFAWTDEGKALMDAWGVSMLDAGDIDDVSFDNEHQWVQQHRCSVIMATTGTTTETTDPATTLSWANAENPAISGSVTYPET